MTPSPSSSVLRRVAGGALTEAAVSFSHDNRFAFLVARDMVRVHAVATGQRVAILRGHTDRVTAAVVSPLNPLQLLTAALDGTIRVWDYSDGTCLRVFSGKRPIEGLLVAPAAEDSSVSGTVLLITSGRAKPGKERVRAYSRIFSFNLAAATASSTVGSSSSSSSSSNRSDSNSNNVLNSCPVFLKTRTCTRWAYDSHGRLLVGASGKTLVVNSRLSGMTRKIEWSHEITALAVHPEEATVAVGDALGRIKLWFELDSVGPDAKDVSFFFFWGVFLKIISRNSPFIFFFFCG